MAAPERCDVLVVGAGLAGLYGALRAAGHGAAVTLVTKGTLRSSNSFWAQGGIAAAVADDDDPALHAADTMRAGDGLCDPAAVDVLCRDGVKRLYDLEALGIRFDRDPDGSLHLGLEGAHGRRRVLQVGGSASGRRMAEPLIARVLADPRIRVLEQTAVLSLAVSDNGCGGAFVLGRDELRRLHARATILATGGACALWSHTTNPPGAVGDGIALAFRAGARVVDLEFVQFHPTALAAGGARDGFLLTEALRGEGATLVTADGARFMPALHPQAELAPRDVVARAIDDQLRRGRTVYLDVGAIGPGRLADRFANIVSALAEAGFDLLAPGARVPVAPAAHYQMGGVETDLDGLTSVPGLYACGEVAGTGVHGANRLASNSLLECFVFAHRAADHAAFAAPVRVGDEPAPSGGGGERPPADLRERMWRDCGLERDGERLRALLVDLEARPQTSSTLVARLVALAALRREESRGGHFRTDFPLRDPALARRLTLDRDELAVLR
jgi:L-aspartate oxidase